MLNGLRSYFANLNPARTVLWCYGLWYALNVWNHFDARPRIWLTSLGLSAIIGFALLLSTGTLRWPENKTQRWLVFRMFLIPFCVSSFAAIVKDAGFILIFPPSMRENLEGAFYIVVFLTMVGFAKSLRNEQAATQASEIIR